MFCEAYKRCMRKFCKHHVSYDGIWDVGYVCLLGPDLARAVGARSRAQRYMNRAPPRFSLFSRSAKTRYLASPRGLETPKQHPNTRTFLQTSSMLKRTCYATP